MAVALSKTDLVNQIGPRHVALACGAVVSLGAAISLAGWVFNIPRLTDWDNNGITIKANAAIALFAISVCITLLAARARPRALIYGLGAFVGLLGGLTLVQHATGVNLGIDLFNEAPGAPATSAPGRMGLPASSSFTLIGLAVVLINRGERSYRRAASFIALLVLVISSLSLSGYLFGADQLYTFPRLTGIAFQTALMIALVAVGIITLVPDQGISEVLSRPDAGGLMFRRLLMPFVVIAIVLGSARVAGQNAGLYDTAFGTAARTLIEIILLVSVLWWTANGLSRFDMQAKRANRKLRDNEESLRIATETGKVGVWDWDLRKNSVTWTDAVYAMHGVERGEFGSTLEAFANLVHPDDRERVNAALQGALERGEPYEVEFRIIRQSDGGTAWLYTNAVLIRDENGPRRMIGATIDITRLKQAELHTARLAAIVESSFDAIVSKDLNGIITSWNKGAERLFGYTAEEAVGKPILMLIPKDRADEEEAILSRTRRGERTLPYDTIRIRRDGQLIEVSLTVSPLRDSEGNIIGASKIARDIAERRRAESALRERETMKRLVDAQESERNRIARDLHDHLGQRLTALRFMFQTLRAQCKDEQLAASIDDIQAFAAEIDTDINYLAWELKPTELENLGLIDALRTFIREWSRTHGVNAEFHLSGNAALLPAGEFDTNLYRIVQEALNNIHKHARATEVSVLLELRDDQLTLIIEDNGKGFDYEAVSNGHSRGGLGLVGMRERAALLNGTLDVESRAGVGTTLFIKMPLIHDASS
jgi:PAS domain S-box-containing protein